MKWSLWVWVHLHPLWNHRPHARIFVTTITRCQVKIHIKLSSLSTCASFKSNPLTFHIHSHLESARPKNWTSGVTRLRSFLGQTAAAQYSPTSDHNFTFLPRLWPSPWSWNATNKTKEWGGKTIPLSQNLEKIFVKVTKSGKLTCRTRYLSGPIMQIG